jgi:hypothetical protein
MEQQGESALRGRGFALALGGALLVLFLRRPDALTNPQFCAEDGIWYAQAYNWHHWSEVPVPIAGYLHLVPRLIARISLLVPMRQAPLVFNLCALAFMAFPVLLLLSSRFASVDLRARIVLSFVYLFLPNCKEIHGTVTSLQWHLAPLGLLVLLADPPLSARARVFDSVVIALCAVSGAFAILLLPIAIVVWWRRRTRAALVSVAFLAAGVALVPLLHRLNPAGRPAAPLGATPELVAIILGGRVVLSSLLGQHGFDFLTWHLAWPYLVFLVWTFTAIGVTVIGAVLLAAPVRLRLFVVFSCLVLAAALRFPMSAPGRPQFPLLAVHGGGRYWFLPMLAFLVSLGWLALAAPMPVRVGARALLLLFPIGALRDFRHPAFEDVGWKREVERFEAAPRGALLHLATYPPGWTFLIEKR